jgi:hypothetical protein
MAKWSVALFGHEKFIPLEVDDPVEYAAAIKRAKPGDVISYRPWAPGRIWVPHTYEICLICSVDGVTEEQMRALKEQEWDLDSYPVYNPLDNGSWRSQLVAWWQTLPQEEQDEKMAWWNSLSEAEKDALYDQYLGEFRNNCRYPTTHKNKRRFQATPADLAAKGVDLGRMMDTGDFYDFQPDFLYTELTDMMLGRKVLPTDGLNVIQPQTDQELEDRRV